MCLKYEIRIRYLYREMQILGERRNAIIVHPDISLLVALRVNRYRLVTILVDASMSILFYGKHCINSGGIRVLR